MSTKWIGLLSVVLLHTTVWAAATLENPAPGAVKSGVGLVSGWICATDRVEVSFDGGPRLFVPYGSERVDTAGVCGDTANGFGLHDRDPTGRGTRHHNGMRASNAIPSTRDRENSQRYAGMRRPE